LVRRFDMVMREFEVTKEFTFYGEYDDMHEIVNKFNSFHAKNDAPYAPHIAHWVDESGCDMFRLWADSQGYSFEMADLIEACITWALIDPTEYLLFVRNWTWRTVIT
jgi:hypothetical protein